MKVNIREKKILFPLILIIGVALVSTLSAMTSKENKEAAAFEEVRAKKGNLKIDLVSDGVIELNTVSLQFGINGVVAQVLVDEGQKIKAGEIIARLEDSKYRNEVEIAGVKLQKAIADMEKIKLQYFPMEKIPEAYARVELETKKLDLDKSNADIQEAQANLNKAQDNLSDTVLKSPIAGTVVQINGKAGETVSSSSNEGGKAFAVVSKDKVKVIAKVLELDIGEVSVGQQVEVTAEAFPDEKLPGKVSKIAYLPTTDSNGIVAYEVEIELLKPNANLRDGMTCSVSFILKEVKDVVILPNKSVKMVEGKQVVEMLSEKGEKIQKEIKTGFTDGTNVEIKEGLQPGDKVLLFK